MNATEFFAVFGKEDVRLRVIGHKGAKKLAWNGALDQADGEDVYFVVNNGGDREKEIYTCCAFFVEWDDKPIEWQLTAWQELSLPEPTLQVFTGGKSIHNYWVLDKPCSVDYWKGIQKRLINYCDSDRALKDPCRVMRVPGFKHSKTGKEVEVVHTSDTRVTLLQMNELLPLLPKKEIVRRVTDVEPGTIDEIVEALSYIPPRQGTGTGTYPMYRNILWGLVAALEAAGHHSPRTAAAHLVESAGWQGMDMDAVAGYQPDQVTAGSFWWWAYQNGYQRPLRLPKPTDERRETWLEQLGWLAPEPGKLVSPTPGEVVTALRAVGDRLRLNRLTDKVEIDGVEADDVRLQLTYIDFQSTGLKVRKETMVDAILRVAMDNSYDPVKEYLERCDVPLPDPMWDNICGELLGKATDFDNTMLRKWLIFAVARVFDPGCAFGTVHILSGEGMAGKSRFFQELAGGTDFFLEGFEPSNNEKDDLLKLHGKWICEWGELDGGISRNANTRLKNMLSTREDSFRKPYGKSNSSYPRRFVICGTTNKSDGFFADETGNRRYVVYHVQEPIDIAKVQALRDGLWACAVRDYLAGREWWPSQDEMLVSELANKDLFQEDIWKESVKAGALHQIGLDGFILSGQILTRSLNIPLERIGQREQVRVNRILKGLGYKKTRRATENGFQTVWVNSK